MNKRNSIDAISLLEENFTLLAYRESKNTCNLLVESILKNIKPKGHKIIAFNHIQALIVDDLVSIDITLDSARDIPVDLQYYFKIKRNLEYLSSSVDIEIEFLNNTKPQRKLSEPTVWAYVYYYLLSNKEYRHDVSPLTSTKEAFYDYIASKHGINSPNFKKAYIKISSNKSGMKNRTAGKLYKELDMAIKKNELWKHPKSLRLAESELEILIRNLKTNK